MKANFCEEEDGHSGTSVQYWGAGSRRSDEADKYLNMRIVTDAYMYSILWYGHKRLFLSKHGSGSCE